MNSPSSARRSPVGLTLVSLVFALCSASAQPSISCRNISGIPGQFTNLIGSTGVIAQIFHDAAGRMILISGVAASGSLSVRSFNLEVHTVGSHAVRPEALEQVEIVA